MSYKSLDSRMLYISSFNLYLIGKYLDANHSAAWLWYLLLTPGFSKIFCTLAIFSLRKL